MEVGEDLGKAAHIEQAAVDVDGPAVGRRMAKGAVGTDAERERVLEGEHERRVGTQHPLDLAKQARRAVDLGEGVDADDEVHRVGAGTPGRRGHRGANRLVPRRRRPAREPV